VAIEQILAGRLVLITDAASGIGEATARAFAARGARLALADRSGAAVRDLAADLHAVAFETDVRSEESVRQTVADAAGALGGLDGLVNAAGAAAITRLQDTTLADWDMQLQTNLTGVFLVCREAIPHLLGARSSTIVNVASASGLAPSLAGAAYSASKAGVIMLSKALSRELGPKVRVNAVCPGIVDTPMFAAMVPERTAAFERKLADDYVLGRLARPEEIARAILFLSSDESSFITGTAMAVDGGRVFH